VSSVCDADVAVCVAVRVAALQCCSACRRDANAAHGNDTPKKKCVSGARGGR